MEQTKKIIFSVFILAALALFTVPVLAAAPDADLDGVSDQRDNCPLLTRRAIMLQGVPYAFYLKIRFDSFRSSLQRFHKCMNISF